MFESLRNREIVLAGGSGGLGSAAAKLLESEGARVIVGFHSDPDRAAEVPGVHLRADITTPEGRKSLLDAAPQLYGLAVFTGTPARVSSPGEMEEAMRLSYEINFLGPILLAREAAERMKNTQTAGAIVLFSTMQTSALFPNSTAYAAPKAALVHAARILAKEFRGPDNIRVNVICPGVTMAGMAAASIASGKYNRYLSDGIIPRFGHAEDIARALRFFLEPDNYVTGQVLTVDGGLTL